MRHPAPAVPASSPQLDLRAVGFAGARRKEHLEKAELELRNVVEEVRRVKANGGRVNVSVVAELAGVSRDVIYDRLAKAADA